MDPRVSEKGTSAGKGLRQRNSTEKHRLTKKVAKKQKKTNRGRGSTRWIGKTAHHVQTVQARGKNGRGGKRSKQKRKRKEGNKQKAQPPGQLQGNARGSLHKGRLGRGDLGGGGIGSASVFGFCKSLVKGGERKNGGGGVWKGFVRVDFSKKKQADVLTVSWKIRDKRTEKWVIFSAALVEGKEGGAKGWQRKRGRSKKGGRYREVRRVG